MQDKKKTIVVGKSTFDEAQTPQAIEKKSQGRITWGLDNLYPYELVGWRQDNPIHGGIIEQKATYLSAAGVDVTGLDPSLAEAVQGMIPEVIDDFETFNGFAVLFKRPSKESTTWTAEQVEFESIRYMCEGNKFAISDDWSVKTQSDKTNYKEVKDIKFAALTGDNADTEVLLYAKIKPKQRKLENGKLSLCYYPVPNYISCAVSILAGIEQDFFTYSESKNGFMGGTVISMNNGTPATEKEADEIADRVKNQATNRNRRGGLTILFSDGADNAATVNNMNGNDLDKRYIESNKEIRNKVMIGHQVVSPTLFAVLQESAFGSKEEMETAYTLFVNNYVSKRQKFVSGALEWAFGRLGIPNVKIVFRKYELVLGTETKTVNNEKMSAKDPVLLRLSKIGSDRKGYSIVKSRTFDFSSSDEDFLSSVQEFDTLTQQQKLILKLINDGKTFSEVSAALGKGALALSLELIKLNAKGLLKGWKVVKPEAVDMEVLYSYEVKAGLGPSLIETSREFCVDMVNLDRLYTRKEIDTLSNELDTDVWRYRGGWYTNPDTGKTTPSCRHEWKQNIVRRS